MQLDCLNKLPTQLQIAMPRFRYFFDTAPSFEAWETHRYLKNRLGIVRALGGGLLHHPYAPCHPPSVPPEEYQVGYLTNYCHQMSSFFFNSADPRGITWGGLPGFPTQLDIFRRWCQGFILSLIHI